MKWVKHPVVEQNLRNLGIKFDIEYDIPFSAIDLAEGNRRQVRAYGSNQDTMLRYSLKMLEDTAWNMVVLQKDKKKYWPWSGNQRLGAYELAKIGHNIDAYVVDLTDPVMMDLLPRIVNTWEAVEGMTKDEAIVNAIHMHDKHRMSMIEAAKLFGIKTESVYKSIRAAESKKKLESLAIPPDRFPSSTLEALGRIDNLNVMKRAASILHKYDVKGNEAMQVINEARQGKTEAQQVVTLEKWETSLDYRKSSKSKKDGVKLPHKRVNCERLLTLMNSLARLCEQNKTITQLQLTDPTHLQTVKHQWNIVAPVMENVLKGE